MAKIYYNKIKGEEINPSTGSPWRIDDVPARWKDAVVKMFQDER